MACYLRVSNIGRTSLRGAVAVAANRAGVCIEDRSTGQVHDYRHQPGVSSRDLVLPAGCPAWAHDRAALWNAVEQAEPRRNAVLAREFEVALPAHLPARDRRRLALELARNLVEAYGCAVDAAIHDPDPEGHQRHPHAHLLLTARRLGPEGFAETARELRNSAAGPSVVAAWRIRFAAIQAGWLRAARPPDRHR